MDRFLGTIALAVLLSCAGCDWSGDDYPEVPTIDRVTLEFIASDTGERQTISAERTSSGAFQASDTLSLLPGEYYIDLSLYEDSEYVIQYLWERPEEPLLRYASEDGLSNHVRLVGRFPPLMPIEGEAQSAAYAAKRSPLPPPGFVAHVDTVGAEGALHLILERYVDVRSQGEPVNLLGTDFDARFPVRIEPSGSAQ